MYKAHTLITDFAAARCDDFYHMMALKGIRQICRE